VSRGSHLGVEQEQAGCVQDPDTPAAAAPAGAAMFLPRLRVVTIAREHLDRESRGQICTVGAAK
jgi:hypothetical protein